jgi:hypothetical protein
VFFIKKTNHVQIPFELIFFQEHAGITCHDIKKEEVLHVTEGKRTLAATPYVALWPA